MLLGPAHTNPYPSPCQYKPKHLKLFARVLSFSLSRAVWKCAGVNAPGKSAQPMTDRATRKITYFTYPIGWITLRCIPRGFEPQLPTIAAVITYPFLAFFPSSLTSYSFAITSNVNYSHCKFLSQSLLLG